MQVCITALRLFQIEWKKYYSNSLKLNIKINLTSKLRYSQSLKLGPGHPPLLVKNSGRLAEIVLPSQCILYKILFRLMVEACLKYRRQILFSLIWSFHLLLVLLGILHYHIMGWYEKCAIVIRLLCGCVSFSTKSDWLKATMWCFLRCSPITTGDVIDERLLKLMSHSQISKTNI